MLDSEYLLLLVMRCLGLMLVLTMSMMRELVTWLKTMMLLFPELPRLPSDAVLESPPLSAYTTLVVGCEILEVGQLDLIA